MLIDKPKRLKGVYVCGRAEPGSFAVGLWERNWLNWFGASPGWSAHENGRAGDAFPFPPPSSLRACARACVSVCPTNQHALALPTPWYQVKLPLSVLRRHCRPCGFPDPLWEALRVRCRRLLRRRRLEEDEGDAAPDGSGDEDEEEDEEERGFSSLRPLMDWGVFLLHLLCMALAAALYCYGYLDDRPLFACAAGVGVGVMVWLAGRLGHEGA